MAQLKSRFLPGTTSPRNPQLIVDYLTMLLPFEGKLWNKETQKQFYEKMKKNLVSEALVGRSKDPAFSARDKINRAPKLLGFVSLKPVISITEAGKAFLENIELRQEILIRQMVKVQFPSPIHKESQVAKGYFNIHPYLELLRLIYTVGGIYPRELKLFGVTLTNYKDFEKKVVELLDYRNQTLKTDKPIRQFHNEYFEKYVTNLYQDQIDAGKIDTRETKTLTVKDFVKKKIRNVNDYGDSYIRYLVGSGLVVLTKDRKLEISKGQYDEVINLLDTVPREAADISFKQWENIMFSISKPKLLSDDKSLLLSKVESIENELGRNPKNNSKSSIVDLKTQLFELNTDLSRINLNSYVDQLKLFFEDDIEDIVDTFASIKKKMFFDNPLYFEWNVWRAFTMIIDEMAGTVIGNFKRNTEGFPMATAPGNRPDIYIEMEETNLVVEVTTSNGRTQHSMEGEPIIRHAGEMQKKTGKETLGIFIAPKINPTVTAELYSRYKINLDIYNGNVKYIPLALSDFVEFFLRFADGKIKLNEQKIKSILSKSIFLANTTKDEFEWQKEITNYILSF